MSDFFKFGGGGTKNVQRARGRLTYAMTPQGQKTLEDLDANGDEITILAALSEKGRPLCVTDIARESRMDTDYCMRLLREMQSKGYVQKQVTTVH